MYVVLNTPVVLIILTVTGLLEYNLLILFYPNTSYYVVIMLDAFSYLFCLKLC